MKRLDNGWSYVHEIWYWIALTRSVDKFQFWLKSSNKQLTIHVKIYIGFARGIEWAGVLDLRAGCMGYHGYFSENSKGQTLANAPLLLP
jgi:hypothetical protein